MSGPNIWKYIKLSNWKVILKVENESRGIRMLKKHWVNTSDQSHCLVPPFLHILLGRITFVRFDVYWETPRLQQWLMMFLCVLKSCTLADVLLWVRHIFSVGSSTSSLEAKFASVNQIINILINNYNMKSTRHTCKNERCLFLWGCQRMSNEFDWL